MTRVTIITAHDGNLPFAALSGRTYREYAQRHGYEFVEDKFLPLSAGIGHPSWQKLALISRHLERNFGGWVVWVDTDTVVTDYTRSLPFPNDGAWLVVSRDWSDSESLWSAGVMLVRSCAAAKYFFETASEKKIKFMNSGCWDQSAMHEVIRDYPIWAGDVRILPRRVLQSVPRECSQGVVDPWQPGDFIAHATGIMQGDKTAILERCHAQAVR